MKSTAAFLLGILFGAPALASGIYAFTDASGVRHFTNQPPPGDGRYKLVMRLPKVRGVLAARPDAVPARAELAAAIAEVARQHQIDAALMHAVVAAESAYNPGAVSPKGAMGLMQLMPATAARYGVSDPFDPTQNLHGGARYLKDLLALFDGELELALAAYNAGEQAVLRHGRRIPPYSETLAYVPKVLQLYRHNLSRM
jgi:soluble lytic murein transglycosylase-like protein